MFDINQVNKTNAFDTIKNVKTQVDYYIENNAHPDIVKIVRLGNKSFGEKAQRIIKECLSLDKPTESGHDILQESTGIKFEVKSARFWVTSGDWKWQHIMEDHLYDYLLMVGVNFNSIDVYVIGKEKFMELKSIELTCLAIDSVVISNDLACIVEDKLSPSTVTLLVSSVSMLLVSIGS